MRGSRSQDGPEGRVAGLAAGFERRPEVQAQSHGRRGSPTARQFVRVLAFFQADVLRALRQAIDKKAAWLSDASRSGRDALADERDQAREFMRQAVSYFPEDERMGLLRDMPRVEQVGLTRLPDVAVFSEQRQAVSEDPDHHGGLTAWLQGLTRALRLLDWRPDHQVVSTVMLHESWRQCPEDIGTLEAFKALLQVACLEDTQALVASKIAAMQGRAVEGLEIMPPTPRPLPAGRLPVSIRAGFEATADLWQVSAKVSRRRVPRDRVSMPARLGLASVIGHAVPTVTAGALARRLKQRQWLAGVGDPAVSVSGVSHVLGATGAVMPSRQPIRKSSLSGVTPPLGASDAVPVVERTGLRVSGKSAAMSLPRGERSVSEATSPDHSPRYGQSMAASLRQAAAHQDHGAWKKWIYQSHSRPLNFLESALKKGSCDGMLEPVSTRMSSDLVKQYEAMDQQLSSPDCLRQWGLVQHASRSFEMGAQVTDADRAIKVAVAAVAHQERNEHVLIEFGSIDQQIVAMKQALLCGVKRLEVTPPLSYQAIRETQPHTLYEQYLALTKAVQCIYQQASGPHRVGIQSAARQDLFLQQLRSALQSESFGSVFSTMVPPPSAGRPRSLSMPRGEMEAWVHDSRVGFEDLTSSLRTTSTPR